LTGRLAESPKAVPWLRLRGLARAAQGNWDMALPDFQEAARLGPKDLLARKGVACAWWRKPDVFFWVPQAPPGGEPKPAKEGLAACDAVLGLDPKAWEFLYLRGLFCVQDGQQDGKTEPALQAFTAALKLHPDFAPALRERGTLHAERGQWAEAVADLARAAELTGPTSPTPWDTLALAQLGRGDTAAYRKTCARMLTMFGRPPPAIWAGGAFAAGPSGPWAAPLSLHAADRAVRLSVAAGMTAVCCTTRPDTLTDWQRLLPLIEKAPADVRGKVFCRAGRFDEAVELLKGNPSTLFKLYLALAEQGRGRTAEAKRLLKETTDWLDKPQTDNPKRKNSDWSPWTERVQIEQLRRELEALLKDKAP
jgi:tetratricopeptide (TPR) repeat protein